MKDRREAASWMRRAACRNDDPDWYFDERNRPQDLSCGHCPVAAACLDEAMTAEHGIAASMRFGIFGGLTTTQRAALAHHRTVPPADQQREAS